jgi:signal transduction histidine kinase
MREKNEETHLYEKRQAVSELQASEKQLKHFAARLMEHQENERRTIALEIHEDIAQSLSAVKWSMEAAMAADTRLTVAESRGMQSVVEQIKAIIALIRRLTKRLSPVMLDTLGVKPAIVVLCQEVMKSRPDSTITPRIDITEGSIPAELEIVVYRVLEDILKLAIRPGRRDRCTVALAVRGGHLKLVCGRMGPHVRALTTAAEKPPALLAIQNRAESFCGALMIKTGQEGGCAISVSWPLREQTQRPHPWKNSPLDCRQQVSHSP